MSSEGWGPGASGVRAACAHPRCLAVSPPACAAAAMDAARQLPPLLRQLLHVSRAADVQPVRGRRGGAGPSSRVRPLLPAQLLSVISARCPMLSPGPAPDRGKPSSDFFTSSYCGAAAHPDKKSPVPHHSCCSRFSGQTPGDAPGHGVAFTAGI